MGRRRKRYYWVVLPLLTAGVVGVLLLTFAPDGGQTPAEIPVVEGDSGNGTLPNQAADPSDSRQKPEPEVAERTTAERTRDDQPDRREPPVERDRSARSSPPQPTGRDEQRTDSTDRAGGLQEVRMVREREQLTRVLAGSEFVPAEDPQFGTPLLMFEKVGSTFAAQGVPDGETPSRTIDFVVAMLDYLNEPTEDAEESLSEFVVESDWVFVESVLQDGVAAVSDPLSFGRLFSIDTEPIAEMESHYLVKARSGRQWLMFDLYVKDGMVRDLILSRNEAADIIEVSP